MNLNGLLDFRISHLQLLAAFTVTILTLSPTTVSALSSTDPSGCTINWHTEDNANAIDGIQAPDVKSAENCQELCINKPRCVAVEWDYSNRSDTHGCWYHENMKDLQELFHMEGAMHYQILSSCPDRRNGVAQSQVTEWMVQSAAHKLRSYEAGLLVVLLTSVTLMLV